MQKRNPFYGGEFSSFTLTSLIEWIDGLNKSSSTATRGEEEEKETDSHKPFRCNNVLKNKYFFDVEYNFARDNENTEPDASDSAHVGIRDELLKLSRKFNIDLSPNLFYSRGKFIELLISSDVAKYCEFRMVTQILTRRENGTLEKVQSDPLS